MSGGRGGDGADLAGRARVAGDEEDGGTAGLGVTFTTVRASEEGRNALVKRHRCPRRPRGRARGCSAQRAATTRRRGRAGARTTAPCTTCGSPEGTAQWWCLTQREKAHRQRRGRRGRGRAAGGPSSSSSLLTVSRSVPVTDGVHVLRMVSYHRQSRVNPGRFDTTFKGGDVAQSR